MASRLLVNRSQRLIAFWPSLKELRSLLHSTSVCEIEDKKLELQLNLPGNIGLDTQLEGTIAHTKLHEEQRKLKSSGDILTTTTIQDHQNLSLLRAFEFQSIESAKQFEIRCRRNLECSAQECPRLLKEDIQQLFPNNTYLKANCTVITFCQKTKNDMSMWNTEVEQEREELMEDFIMLASGICKALTHDGYFADFIDPCSGTPHYGDNSAATLFETDERYRLLGFEIEDLGCCKVIRHHLWGMHSFVGSIFTNAKLDSGLIQKLLTDYNHID